MGGRVVFQMGGGFICKCGGHPIRGASVLVVVVVGGEFKKNCKMGGATPPPPPSHYGKPCFLTSKDILSMADKHHFSL